MGQGALTGLAQLVAEALGCDRPRAPPGCPTPGQNLARHRPSPHPPTDRPRRTREPHQPLPTRAPTPPTAPAHPSAHAYDAAAIQNRPGVKKVIAVGDSAVAVVADTWWRAKTALDAMPIEWDAGPHAALSSDGIAATLKEGLDATEAFVGNQQGDVGAALDSAARRVDAL